MGIPICGACRRPIEGRVVTALGKHWCVEHFVCAKCEKPFLGNRHYERKGLAYCETHYHQLFGNLCHVCNNVSKKSSRKSVPLFPQFLCSILMLHSMSFSGHPRRRVHGPEQGVVREPLRLLLLRPEDDSQDKVLRGRPQTSLQKVLRQASSILFFV